MEAVIKKQEITHVIYKKIKYKHLKGNTKKSQND